MFILSPGASSAYVFTAYGASRALVAWNGALPFAVIVALDGHFGSSIPKISRYFCRTPVT
ncbi:MAG: hypothetical protein OXI05_05560 [Bacteroidota bacterium]|nr:hypothetical protein [Bacteroidota bacterium]MXW14562.1 hypothetical protein [Rhodothermaceae bacterium]MDE2645287.1 hypothetical protein [Bacteroidota bacterium]MXW34025.1 hypothetical protein [Rhodothermaceae bacterium]MYC04541.1 hypothetical protein [Rhodothermaceae bacterium]